MIMVVKIQGRNETVYYELSESGQSERMSLQKFKNYFYSIHSKSECESFEASLEADQQHYSPGQYFGIITF